MHAADVESYLCFPRSNTSLSSVFFRWKLYYMIFNGYTRSRLGRGQAGHDDCSKKGRRKVVFVVLGIVLMML
jgi:hypothetical protein